MCNIDKSIIRQHLLSNNILLLKLLKNLRHEQLKRGIVSSYNNKKIIS